MPRKKPEKPRRGHNEGSIYPLKNGRYAAALSLGNGKRKYFYGRTWNEVSGKLKRAQYQQEQGLLLTSKPQKMRAFLEQWLEEVKKSELKGGSYLSYRQALDLHLIPGIGAIDVQKLTPLEVQRLYANLGKRLEPSTVHRIHAVLHDALQYAVKTEIVARNVCDVVSLPRMTKKERQTLKPEEVKQLFAAVRGHWIEPMLVVAITTGLRRGEILGLEWSDIDLKQGRMTVRRSAGWQKGRGTVSSTTKTERERTIVLIPLAVSALKEHRAKQKIISKIVFCNDAGEHRSGGRFYEVFQASLAKAGLPPMRLHDLRHSVGSILIGLGIDIKIVQVILGHASIKTTADIYLHVKPEMQQEAMDRLGELFR